RAPACSQRRRPAWCCLQPHAVCRATPENDAGVGRLPRPPQVWRQNPGLSVEYRTRRGVTPHARALPGYPTGRAVSWRQSFPRTFLSGALMVKTVLLRRREVEARTGLSRSTIYQKVADGEFPARGRVRLSRRDRHFEGFAKQCCGGFFRG